MPRNAGGTFNLVPGNPVASGTTISSNWANTTLSDIAQALTESLASDGRTPITGPLKGFSGSAAAPGYSFSADTSTGMYLVGAAQLGLSTGGIEKARIDASGNFLVGATTAAAKLHVQGSNGEIFRANATQTTGRNNTRILNDANTGIFASVYGSAFAGGTLFGVGPNGSAIAQDGAAPLAIGTTGAQKLFLGTNSVAWWQMQPDGKLGYGVTAPEAPLHVRPNIIVGDVGATVGLNLQDSFTSLANPIPTKCMIGSVSAATGLTNGSLWMQPRNVVGAVVAIGSNDLERLRVTYSGGVVLGGVAPFDTDIPGRLQLVSANSRQISYRLSSNAAGKFFQTGVDSTNGYQVMNQGGVGVVLQDGLTTWAAVSDETLKTDLVAIDGMGLWNWFKTVRTMNGRYLTDAPEQVRSFQIAQDWVGRPEVTGVGEDGKLLLAPTNTLPYAYAVLKAAMERIEQLEQRVLDLEAIVLP